MRPLVFLSLLITHSVFALPRISIDTKYYPVYGHDARSIRRSIEKTGPIGSNSQRFHAHTDWDLSWSYRWIQGRGGCQITSTSVELKVSYLLPQLQQPEKVDPKYKVKWDAYFEALFEHEQQHKDHGVLAARELEQRLMAIPPQQSCATLEELMQKTADEVFYKYDDMGKELDRTTDHGAKRGVILP
jgi:predicted secreted Zn-dependent protease